MKKIINGKVYDTEKAELIATADHENIKFGYAKDAPHETQSLYRKKTGEFFLYAPNGSTQMHNIRQHEYRSYGGFFPLSYEEAKIWAERELTAEKWEEIFGDPEDDNSTVQTVITMPAVKLAKIKQEAAKAGMTVSAYIVSKCIG